MSAQQIAIAETIRGLKLSLRRDRAASPASDSSDDADDLHTHTNRGNKLRSSARYVHEGTLDTTGGEKRYKRKISHAGYDRHIIAKRPKLYDEDGDVVDPADIPSDAEDERLYGEPIEEDPFGHVQLDELLRPLTSAAEVAEHPGFRRAYTNKALTQMAEEAAEMVRREKAALWKAKRLLEQFRGDGGWMACERFETEQDLLLLRDEDAAAGDQSAVPSIVDTEGAMEREEGTLAVFGEQTVEQPEAEAMDGVEAHDHFAEAQARDADEENAEQAVDTTEQEPAPALDKATNGEMAHAPEGEAHNDTRAEDVSSAANPAVTDLTHNDEDSSSNPSSNNPPSHAMTTRARARSPQQLSSPSPSPSDSASIPSIHPWFHLPTTALPDRDLGLPPTEAEDTRKLLLLYVQKQENIVRQLNQLYNGLQRTDRLRRNVYQAAKAEGHTVSDGKGNVVTEMSDGEDWYDPSDWDLQSWELRDGKLEKGKDEVEDPAEDEVGRRVGGRRRRVVGR